MATAALQFRLDNVFASLKSKNEAALVTFITAGDPQTVSTEDLIVHLAQSGADIIEVGIPYSDPLADGPSIQASGQRSLDNGTNPAIVLQDIAKARARTNTPIVIMTSYNLVYCYGVERFAVDAAAAGIDGAILTDLPPEEAADWKRAADSAGVATIFLIAPTSTPERIRLISEQSSGFIYVVSRTGVTGARNEMPVELHAMLQTIRSITSKPICVGFGISQPDHVSLVAADADGAVIGSALVDYLHNKSDAPTFIEDVRSLVSSWKSATQRS